MSLKIKAELFEDKQKFSSLCLGTSKTLSLGEFDESKSHIILSPFFINILRLNVKNNAKLWSLHPKLFFAGI